jgi:hypothetical protein
MESKKTTGLTNSFSRMHACTSTLGAGGAHTPTQTHTCTLQEQAGKEKSKFCIHFLSHRNPCHSKFNSHEEQNQMNIRDPLSAINHHQTDEASTKARDNILSNFF